MRKGRGRRVGRLDLGPLKTRDVRPVCFTPFSCSKNKIRFACVLEREDDLVDVWVYTFTPSARKPVGKRVGALKVAVVEDGITHNLVGVYPLCRGGLIAVWYVYGSDVVFSAVEHTGGRLLPSEQHRARYASITNAGFFAVLKDWRAVFVRSPSDVEEIDWRLSDIPNTPTFGGGDGKRVAVPLDAHRFALIEGGKVAHLCAPHARSVGGLPIAVNSFGIAFGLRAIEGALLAHANFDGLPLFETVWYDLPPDTGAVSAWMGVERPLLLALNFGWEERMHLYDERGFVARVPRNIRKVEPLEGGALLYAPSRRSRSPYIVVKF